MHGQNAPFSRGFYTLITAESSFLASHLPILTKKSTTRKDAGSTPEHCDGQDNDSDTLVDEGYDYNGNTVPDCTEEGLDSDGDTIPNTVDEDDDNDGFSDAAENYMGLDSLSDCGPGAWAPDVNNDAEVDILDVLHYAGKLRAAYDRRYDLNADGHVDILDVLVYKWELGKTCPNP